jgi:hypothetical protein
MLVKENESKEKLLSPTSITHFFALLLNRSNPAALPAGNSKRVKNNDLPNKMSVSVCASEIGLLT